VKWNYLALFIFYAKTSFAYLNPPQTISLISKEAYEIIELGNSLPQLCPMKEKDLYEKCKSEKMKSRDFIYTLYESPEEKSKKLGKIKLTVTPSKGYKSYYINEKNIESAFESDDGGEYHDYGQSFVFTVADKKGDWIQLPKRPFATAVWINPVKDMGPNSNIVPATIYTTSYESDSYGTIVFTKFQGDEVSFRKENDADFNCEGSEVKVTPEQLKEMTIKVEKLYDKDGHLQLSEAHRGGC